MLSTAYSLPFAFELPIGSAWDGARPVDLVVHTSSALSPVDAQRVGMIVQSFWLMAGAVHDEFPLQGENRKRAFGVDPHIIHFS